MFKKFPGFVSDIREGKYSLAAENLKYKDISKVDEAGNIVSKYTDKEGVVRRNISNWYDQVGGRVIESRVSSGEYPSKSLLENRATHHYHSLKSLPALEKENPTDFLINEWTNPESTEF